MGIFLFFKLFPSMSSLRSKNATTEQPVDVNVNDIDASVVCKDYIQTFNTVINVQNEVMNIVENATLEFVHDIFNAEEIRLLQEIADVENSTSNKFNGRDDLLDDDKVFAEEFSNLTDGLLLAFVDPPEEEKYVRKGPTIVSRGHKISDKEEISKIIEAGKTIQNNTDYLGDTLITNSNKLVMELLRRAVYLRKAIIEQKDVLVNRIKSSTNTLVHDNLYLGNTETHKFKEVPDSGPPCEEYIDKPCPLK